MGQPEKVAWITITKDKTPIPLILIQIEIPRLLDGFTNAKYRMFFTLIYATGMRIREASQLQTQDIDAMQQVIAVCVRCCRHRQGGHPPHMLRHAFAPHLLEHGTDLRKSTGTSSGSATTCRDRHCPKCQARAQEHWIAARCEQLLNLGHFHGVFTLPSELRPLAMRHPLKYTGHCSGPRPKPSCRWAVPG